MTKNYIIFGKIVQIVLHDNENIIQKNIISKHFGLYEELSKVDNPDIVINILKHDNNNDVIGINPKTHIEVNNGFKSVFSKVSVEFRRDKCLTVNVFIKHQKKGFINYLKKLYNIQYSSIDERISQILYELVLIPSAYFDSSNFLIHSSAFIKDGNGAILIGGTGGVGKTSLEIELCMNRGYSFIADDISVVSNDAFVWSNLAFPKIYAYNLKNNAKLKKQIFKNRSIHDKLAWKFLHFINGAAGVRRTVSPIDAYGKYQIEKSKIDKYYILVKKNVENINVEKISAKAASMMTLHIIQSEYSVFNNHILWHEFNCKAFNTDPILRLEEVFANWRENSEKVLADIDCFIVNIPLNINHDKFVKHIADIIG